MELRKWDGKVPFPLWAKWNDAYGAVLHGVYWTGRDVDEVSRGEAMDLAAEFLEAFGDWLKEKP